MEHGQGLALSRDQQAMSTMSPERWLHIKSLLQSALERTPAERAAFLDQACAGDAQLQSEVESLIASHEQNAGFIETPAFELMARAGQDRKETLRGARFGRYQILDQLG